MLSLVVHKAAAASSPVVNNAPTAPTQPIQAPSVQPGTAPVQQNQHEVTISSDGGKESCAKFINCLAKLKNIQEKADSGSHNTISLQETITQILCEVDSVEVNGSEAEVNQIKYWRKMHLIIPAQELSKKVREADDDDL